MPPVIWITGLPGSGKSSVAEALHAALPGSIVLSMDDLRKIATPNPTYSDQERDLLYRSLVYLARILRLSGHTVIIDATGHLRTWRDLARTSIPDYREVFLRCPVDVCRDRERRRTDRHGAPRDIYRKAEEGWPVPGINVPYEEPDRPELAVDTSTTGIGEIVSRITEMLRR